MYKYKKIYRQWVLRDVLILMTFVFFSNTALCDITVQVNKEAMSNIAALEGGKSRLVFYGANHWKPKIKISGVTYDSPYGLSINFSLDIPNGTYDISVDGVSVYTLNAKDGETYYHEMAKIRNIYRNLVLELWRVEPAYGKQMIKTTTHWVEDDKEY